MQKEERSNIIAAQLEWGFSIKRRYVWLAEEIFSASTSFIMSKIDLILDSSKSKSPIDLFISSYGGEVYGVTGLIDYINSLPVKINTIAYGPAMSAAAILLTSGTGKRKMSKNSIVMIHEVQSWNSGSTSNVINEAEHTKKLQNLIFQILGERTNQKADWWLKRSRTNLYLPSDKCLEYGIVDEII